MSFNKYIDNTGAFDYKIKAKPMTFAELRERIKHIEMLCASLSIDLANEMELRERLKVERDRAAEQVKTLTAELSEYRRREYDRNYNRTRRVKAITLSGSD